MKNGFVQFHWLHRRLDGSEFLAEVSLTTIPYAGDLALYAKWRDITEIEQYKKSLLISEQRYRQLFETMLNGFALHEIILDEHNQPVDYRFIVVNPAFEKLTGLRAENIVGKTVLEVMPNTEPYWIETYGRVACTGDPVLIENYSQELTATTVFLHSHQPKVNLPHFLKTSPFKRRTNVIKQPCYNFPRKFARPIPQKR